MSARAALTAGAVVLLCAAGPAGCGSGALQTGPPAQARATAQQTVIFDCGGRAHVRPPRLTLACADANASLTDIRWRHWGAGTSTAAATERANSCEPNCAAGRIVVRRVRLRASGLALSGTALTYQRLSVGRGSYRLTAQGPVTG